MGKFSDFNEKLAVSATKMFGSMTAFWLCFIWAILPLFPFMVNAKDFILYISAGVIQLIALPLIMVGTSVLNAATERRASEDHDMIMREMQELKDMHEDAHQQIKELQQVQEKLIDALKKDEEELTLLKSVLQTVIQIKLKVRA